LLVGKGIGKGETWACKAEKAVLNHVYEARRRGFGSSADKLWFQGNAGIKTASEAYKYSTLNIFGILLESSPKSGWKSMQE